MALIGVNPIQQKPQEKEEDLLTKIAKGVQLATSVLQGAGAVQDIRVKNAQADQLKRQEAGILTPAEALKGGLIEKPAQPTSPLLPGQGAATSALLPEAKPRFPGLTPQNVKIQTGDGVTEKSFIDGGRRDALLKEESNLMAEYAKDPNIAAITYAKPHYQTATLGIKQGTRAGHLAALNASVKMLNPNTKTNQDGTLYSDGGGLADYLAKEYNRIFENKNVTMQPDEVRGLKNLIDGAWSNYSENALPAIQRTRLKAEEAGLNPDYLGIEDFSSIAKASALKVDGNKPAVKAGPQEKPMPKGLSAKDQEMLREFRALGLGDKK